MTNFAIRLKALLRGARRTTARSSLIAPLADQSAHGAIRPEGADRESTVTRGSDNIGGAAVAAGGQSDSDRPQFRREFEHALGGRPDAPR